MLSTIFCTWIHTKAIETIQNRSSRGKMKKRFSVFWLLQPPNSPATSHGHARSVDESSNPTIWIAEDWFREYIHLLIWYNELMKKPRWLHIPVCLWGETTIISISPSTLANTVSLLRPEYLSTRWIDFVCQSVQYSHLSCCSENRQTQD